jgi:hypothetical protein
MRLQSGDLTAPASLQAGQVLMPSAESIGNSDPPLALPAGKFRRERFKLALALIDQIISKNGQCRIVDLGGLPEYWDELAGDLGDRPFSVEIINLEEPKTQPANPRLSVRAGDACEMAGFTDNAYDLVHSNSVIEHVGTWPSMERFALHARRLAPHLFIQTPYFWFPIEPHFRLPCFNLLPEAWRMRLVMSRACGFFPKMPDPAIAMRAIQGSQLLDRKQMAVLFPDARIEMERWMGLPKSMIAIR